MLRAVNPLLLFVLKTEFSMHKKISRLSHRELYKKTQSNVNESYLHWYKSHQNSLRSSFAGFHTEDCDNEYLVDDPKYYNRCMSCLWDPYVNCYISTKKIRAYRHYMQDIYEDMFSSLRWIDLPGGQHQVAVERNYLMNYIWLIGFLTNELDTVTNKDTGRQLRYRLEELVIQAESLGIALQGFFKPLQTLVQYHSYIEEMADIMLTDKIPRPEVEKKILRIQIKPDTTLFTGNKVEDFTKLLVYARRDCQVWSRFKTIPDVDKLEIVTKGMMEITDVLKDLQASIKKPIRALKFATISFFRFLPYAPPTLTVHVQKMKSAVKTIMLNTNYTLEDDDREILESLLQEVSEHYQYIMRFGELLVEEIWDIVLMTRLSYEFIKESPNNNITAVAYDAVVQSRMKKKVHMLLKRSNFKLDDFFRVDCPDTLRKLPVVVTALNAELSLHLQGYRNFNLVKAPEPMHKFSEKRRGSKMKDDDEVHSEGGSVGDKPSLLFVTEL